MLHTKNKIGALDKRVIIIYPTESTDSNTNEKKLVYNMELAEVWARVKEFKGNDVMIAEKLTETKSMIVTIRYRSDITTVMRLVYDQRQYYIRSIGDMSETRKRYMDLNVELIDNEFWT